MKPDVFTGDPSKDQILSCLVDLSYRASELGYPTLASDLIIVAFAETKGLEYDLSSLIATYAKINIPELRGFIKPVGGIGDIMGGPYHTPQKPPPPPDDDTKQ